MASRPRALNARELAMAPERFRMSPLQSLKSQKSPYRQARGRARFMPHVVNWPTDLRVRGEARDCAKGLGSQPGDPDASDSKRWHEKPRAQKSRHEDAKVEQRGIPQPLGDTEDRYRDVRDRVGEGRYREQDKQPISSGRVWGSEQPQDKFSSDDHDDDRRR